MRAVHIPHSAVPESQFGHTDGEPDAVVQHLAEIPDVIQPWR
jgi:putative hydrolase of the HAD superfamily